MRSILFVIAMCLTGTPSWSAIDTITGNEETRWKSGWNSVVVAQVKEVRKVEGNTERGTHQAVLVPQATLAGTLDPGAAPELKVRLWVGRPWYGTSLRAAPAEGDMIVAVLQNGPAGLTIEKAICTFMPDGESSFASVRGMDDPKVLQIIERLRAIRSKAAAAATRPASGAAK